MRLDELKHFRMTKLEFRMLCNEISPLDGPVLCCPMTKERLILMHIKKGIL